MKPFSGVTVTVVVPLVPCASVRLLGEADSVKVGGGLTVTEIDVELVKLPDEPVIVTVTVPVVAALLAVKVNVLALVELVGLKEALSPPFGRPGVEKVTLPLKPFCGVTLMVLVPLEP